MMYKFSRKTRQNIGLVSIAVFFVSCAVAVGFAVRADLNRTTTTASKTVVAKQTQSPRQTTANQTPTITASFSASARSPQPVVKATTAKPVPTTAKTVPTTAKPVPPPQGSGPCTAYRYYGTNQNLCADFPSSADVDCSDVQRQVTLPDYRNDPWALDGRAGEAFTGERGIGCEEY